MAAPPAAADNQMLRALGDPVPQDVTWQGAVQEIEQVPTRLKTDTDWNKLKLLLHHQLRSYMELYLVPQEDIEYYKQLIAIHPYGLTNPAVKALIYEILINHVPGIITVTFSDVKTDGYDWIKTVYVPALCRGFVGSGYFPSRSFFDGLPPEALTDDVKTHRRVACGVWKQAGFIEIVMPSGDLFMVFQPHPRVPVARPAHPVSIDTPAEMPAAPCLGQDSAFTPAKPRPKPFALTDAPGGQ